MYNDRIAEGFVDGSEAVISYDCQENIFCVFQFQEYEELDGVISEIDGFVWVV